MVAYVGIMLSMAAHSDGSLWSVPPRQELSGLSPGAPEVAYRAFCSLVAGLRHSGLAVGRIPHAMSDM